ncbi:hydroxymethylpyrimidine permease [Spirochaetia bacterium]|nr:hydroxymethylpyrimidine permease [Spirochaetia bacterium]
MKKGTLLLLWLGAAISISEIFTGGLIAPLGLAKGLGAILIGHLIGTGLLTLGGYVSFCRKEAAMESVAFSLGSRGGALAAFCNVVQLTGWTVVMVVQAGSALTGFLPDIPFRLLALILSALVLVWALIFGSPAARINEAAVCLLAILCLVLFFEAASGGMSAASGDMSMVLAIELSIAMPISWLPLAGDYARRAETKGAAVLMPFIGYFAGSVLMYGFGLFIGLSSGGNGDIFSFITASRFRLAACFVVLLSTLTTAFLDLYSAAVSSGHLVKTKNERTPILIIGLIAVLISVFFPMEKYGLFLENFLLAIGSVFVPIYTILFIDFFLKRPRHEKPFRLPALGIALSGIIGYHLFNRFNIWIPTVMTILLVALLYTLVILLPVRLKRR